MGGVGFYNYIPVLIGGYLFIRFSPFFFYTQYRLTTQRLLFSTITAAFIFFIPSSILVEFSGFSLSKLDYLENKYEVTGLNISSLSFALSIVFLGLSIPLKWNDRFMKWMFYRSVYHDNDGLEVTLADAFKGQILVGITLDNDKVYVGCVISPFSSPSFETKTVRILPFLSGYRDKDTRKLSITNFYNAIYETDSDIESLSNLEIAIPIRHIVTLSFFYSEVFNEKSDITLDLGEVVTKSAVNTSSGNPPESGP